jgi:hypothetical protein
MPKQTRDILIAIVAIAAAVFSVYYAVSGRSEKVNLDTYSVLGTVAAEESAKLTGNKGEVLILVPDSGPNKNPSVEAEVKAFQELLKKQKLTMAMEKVEVTPMLMMATGGGVPPEQFFKALEKHKGVAAVVLLFGFPELSDADVETLKKYNVKTIVVSSFRSGYKRFMDSGALQLVISPRQDTPPTSTQQPRTVRERFDQDFVLISAGEARRAP